MNNELVTLPSAHSFDPFERIADEENTGTILKFAKGEWIAEDRVINGTRLIAEMDKLAIGWRKWIDGKIVDMNIGYAAEDFRPKARSELGDTDSNSWPLNTRGERNDPWQHGYYLRLSSEDGDEIYAWAATSFGARKEVGTLTRAYANRRKRRLGGLPIIVLGADTYRHKEFGKVDIPRLEGVGWTEAAPTAAAIAPPPKVVGHVVQDLDDSIPF
jgi:hypothetical protein